MASRFLTLDIFHLDKSLLNEVQRANIAAMLIALAGFQLDRFPLKLLALTDICFGSKRVIGIVFCKTLAKLQNGYRQLEMYITLTKRMMKSCNI